jgi:hypothetical protein
MIVKVRNKKKECLTPVDVMDENAWAFEGSIPDTVGTTRL